MAYFHGQKKYLAVTVVSRKMLEWSHFPNGFEVLVKQGSKKYLSKYPILEVSFFFANFNGQIITKFEFRYIVLSNLKLLFQKSVKHVNFGFKQYS